MLLGFRGNFRVKLHISYFWVGNVTVKTCQNRNNANESWEKFTVPQLKEYLKEKGVRGYSKCKKQELIEIAENIDYYTPKVPPEITNEHYEINEEIEIYTDGCCFRNGRPDAIAGVGVYFGPKDNRNISEPLSGNIQTNQRAEITAVIRALQSVPKDSKVSICTDSSYVINGK